ncbi:MAG TPA: PEP-CTERM sorting domain-containing protein [Gemmataceae bacterium]|nr:PEP-CTERM sorting domain-containing protein [Gemmataceae bacterium]
MFHRVRPTTIVILAVLSCSAMAADTGAVGNGDWSNAATWTNGVPGVNDSAYIGCGNPTGAALDAAVTLSQDTSAGHVYLGFSYGTSGTIDLRGFTLTASDLTLGVAPGPDTAAIIRRTGGGALVTNSTEAYLGNLVLAPGDMLSGLSVYNSARVTTGGIGNVTFAAEILSASAVGSPATLNLGADFKVDFQVFVGGVLNANGHAVTAGEIEMGYSSIPGSFQNDGPVTAGSWNQRYGTVAKLHQPGDTLGSLLLTQNSQLTVSDAAGQTVGLTITDKTYVLPPPPDVAIDPGSSLVLEVNGQAGGWVFRWANPATGGNHIVELQNLINGGEINFTSLNGGSYSLSADSQYTYINVVPEPSSLALLAAAGSAAAVVIRRRGNWARSS